MATKKLQTPNTANPTADQAFINSIFAETKSEPTPAETGSNATGTAANSEKVLVNFKMSKAYLERLRAYCKENDMTLTAGIKRAIRKMLNE